MRGSVNATLVETRGQIFASAKFIVEMGFFDARRGQIINTSKFGVYHMEFCLKTRPAQEITNDLNDGA